MRISECRCFNFEPKPPLVYHRTRRTTTTVTIPTSDRAFDRPQDCLDVPRLRTTALQRHDLIQSRRMGNMKRLVQLFQAILQSFCFSAKHSECVNIY